MIPPARRPSLGDSFEQSIEFQQIPTPFRDETPAGTGVVHDAGKGLVQLVR
jgi:hypothetical protein